MGRRNARGHSVLFRQIWEIWCRPLLCSDWIIRVSLLYICCQRRRLCIVINMIFLSIESSFLPQSIFSFVLPIVLVYSTCIFLFSKISKTSHWADTWRINFLASTSSQSKFKVLNICIQSDHYCIISFMMILKKRGEGLFPQKV